MSNLLKSLRLLATFYSNFAFVSLLITAIVFYFFARRGFHMLQWVLFLRIVMSVIIYFFISAYKAKEMYYYYNLGISKRFLWISTLGVDFFLSLVGLYIIYRFQ